MDRRSFLRFVSLAGGGFVSATASGSLAHGDGVEVEYSNGFRTACRCGAFASPPATEKPRREAYVSNALRLPRPHPVPLVFCPLCGGRGSESWEEELPACRCGALPRWAADPASIFDWHPAAQCYVVEEPEVCLWLVFFCPACGGSAPGSLIGPSASDNVCV